ncbi:MAG TPA: protein kinase, partial [Polyangiales bacterium]|nr:protein kinase [Polyangiales bacterium]
MDYRDAQQADRLELAEQLGPYTLIAEISSGEFTTVHLAHKRGAHGFDRLVAIKRLKPAYARQPEWSQLLLDEARLGASVDHPNTVDILDVGTDAGVYVVMDYVEGADLEQLLARAGRERHPRFVLPSLIDALTGLHAIHTQKDELGEPLAMVHQA